MSGEFVISLVLPQQKFEVMDGQVLQLSFIWQAKGNTSSKCKWADPKDPLLEATGSILAPLFCMFFSPPPRLPYLNQASQEGCLFYLRFSLQFSVLRSSFVIFLQAFPFFVF